MAYRVLYKGLEVVCETPEDVDALAESSTRGQGRRKESQQKQHRSIKRLVRGLGDKQRSLLTRLAESDKPVLDSELRSILGLEDNKALAGVLASISKLAKGAGLDRGSIINKTMTRNGSGDRHYAYSIAPEACEEVVAGLTA